MSDPYLRLDPNKPVSEFESVKRLLAQNIFGQDHVIDPALLGVKRMLSEYRDPRQPLASLLFLGPTGVGKTEIARVLAKALFDSRHGLTKVSCELYGERHTTSQLLGAPPSYVGYEDPPYLLQDRLEESHMLSWARHSDAGEFNIADDFVIRERSRDITTLEREPIGEYASVVLFDEIEKAHPEVQNSLLAITDEGSLDLRGDWGATDFSRSIVIMTSNAGSREIVDMMQGNYPGFVGTEKGLSFENVQREVLSEAETYFSPEFLGRFDKVVVFRPLTTAVYEKIFDKISLQLQNRITASGLPILLEISERARALVLEEGTDIKTGARYLEKTFEALVEDPLTMITASGQIHEGDIVRIKEGPKKSLSFSYQDREIQKVVFPSVGT